jgi:ABC-type lipoprotein export system ATPase subunit
MKTGDLSNSSEPQIVCENLVKIYKVSTLEVVALQGLDLCIGAGEMVGIVGKSGSGKSTLLSILGGYDIPSAGKVRVAGHDLLALSGRRLTAYRQKVIGFVWQQTARNLLPYLSARRNVELPMLYAGASPREAGRRGDELLAFVGLEDRRHHRPAELSGGEQQRVAIAVALSNRPSIILADEPTGELDVLTAKDILDMLKSAQQQLNVTVIVVTHDAAVSAVADRLVAIRDGRTSSEQIRAITAGAFTGEHRGVQEYVIVDRAGRLQVPHEYLGRLGIVDRAVIRVEDDRIIIEAAPTQYPAGRGEPTP